MVAYEFSTEVTQNRTLAIQATTAPTLHPGAQVRVILLVEDNGQQNGHTGYDFDQQVSIDELSEYPLMPVDELAEQFRAALTEAGYDTEEKVVELVRSVRCEIAVEKGRLPAPPYAEVVHK